MNEMCIDVANGKYSKEDYAQLMQLIGYSVSGYGELSMIPRKEVRRADLQSLRLERED